MKSMHKPVTTTATTAALQRFRYDVNNMLFMHQRRFLNPSPPKSGISFTVTSDEERTTARPTQMLHRHHRAS
ncbi:hypothetical protein RYX36_028852 [Vicia faba]